MRLPPGEPVTRNGLPSLSTMVGDIDDSGRLPGPGRVGVAAEQAVGIRRAGLGGEIVELVVEQDAGAVGDEAEAVAEIERVGVGDRVAVAVDHREMRGVVALVRRRRRRRGCRRAGARALGIDARRAIRRHSSSRSGRATGTSTKAGIAEKSGAVGIGALHRLDHQCRRLRRSAPCARSE